MNIGIGHTYLQGFPYTPIICTHHMRIPVPRNRTPAFIGIGKAKGFHRRTLLVPDNLVKLSVIMMTDNR